MASLAGCPGDLLEALLSGIVGLFQEPQGLPPQRHLSHRIRLQHGTPAAAVRPYRYALAQKDELERQCADMLRLGIILHSSSAFSSPALLIKKRDGLWRFCVDYRTLNAKTIKDKFPTPVVEELLDEFRGTKILHQAGHALRLSSHPNAS